MNKQIRNIANAYVIVMGLVLLMLLIIAIRVVDVYYYNEAKEVLETRASQLESVYSNYSEAGVQLKDLNTDYIDKILHTRLEGVLDILKKTTPRSEDLSARYGEIFRNLDGHRIDLVQSDGYLEFMSSTYGLKVTEYTEELAYFDASVEGANWRVASSYVEEKEAFIIAAEDISAVDALRAEFEKEIGARIEEHMKREPMNVSVIVVGDDGSLKYCSEHQGYHNELELIDMRTGKNVFDLVNEIENGQFEYQIITADGFKDYFAIVKPSDEYDAYLIMSMEKQDLVTQFGDSAGVFLKIVLILLTGFCIWTVYRFKRILGNDFAIHHQRTNDNNSTF